MKKNLIWALGLLMLFIEMDLPAQTTTKQVTDLKIQTTYAKFLGKTPPLRHLANRDAISLEKRAEIKKQKQVPNFMGRRIRPNVNPNALPKGEDKLRQSEVNRDAGIIVEPVVNIEGMGQNIFGGNPPDPCGDIGKDYYIQQINASYLRVFDKEGNPVSNPIATNTIWSSIGFSSSGDPIILYDQEAERWYITEFPSGNQLLVAVSETSDPLGSWNAYNFATPNFPDYPKYSLWTNALVVTTNEQGPGVLPSYFINREALLNGEPTVPIQRIQLPGIGGGPGFQVATPVDWTGMTAPPQDALPMIMTMSDDAWGGSAQDQLEIFTFEIDWANPNNTVVHNSSIVTAPYDSNPCAAPGPNFGCIPQLGGQGIDGLPEVIMHQVHYRNFGAYEVMVLNFITDASGGNNVSGIRWMELRRNPGGDWTIYQEGTFAPNDGLHRFMGGIAIDGNGNIALGYSISSPNTHPGLAFTGRRASDPLGEMTVEEYVVTEGFSTNQTGRFGDYAQMTVDPYDDKTFWYTGEYRAQNIWSTKIFAFNLGRDTTDMGPSALSKPVSSPALTANELVSIEVKNFGIDTISNFNVGYIFENGPAIVDTINFILPTDSVYAHTFIPTVDMSVVGDYEFKIFTELTGDDAPNNDTLRVVVSKLPRFDAGILEINGLEGILCGDSIPVDIVLINYGTENLTTVEIEIQLNGDLYLGVNWTGDLASGESETLTYNLLGLLNGSNEVFASTLNPNGMTDEIPDNDGFSRSFDAILDGVDINFELKTDFFPQETTWEITNEAGDVILSGGPYTNQNSIINETWCLDPEACYTFTIFDAVGDGLDNPFGGQNLNGYYEITDANGLPLASILEVNFGFSESNDFCGTFSCMMEGDIDFVSESAAGANDGTILITPVNGIGPFQYSIDGGMSFQASNMFNNLAGGDYVIVIQGDLDCLYEVVFTLPTCALNVSGVITNESVPGAGDGQIEVITSNGVPPYQYSLNGGAFGAWPFFANLSEGAYQVAVRDALGCELEITVMLGLETSSKESLFGYSIEVFPNPTEGLFRLDINGLSRSEVFLPLQIIDASGKKIQNFKLVKYDNTYTGLLSLVAYPAGIYYVRFLDEELNQMVKVVKQ